MIKALFKKQLLELFSGFFTNRKTGKLREGRSLLLYALLWIFVFGSVAFTFFNMAMGLGTATVGQGYDRLYFALIGLISVALGVFGSVFSTYTALYLPKDNEWLLSLPVPGRILVLVRTAEVYISSLLYSALVWVPGLVAYFMLAKLSVRKVLFPVLLTFLLALFVSVLSCILGFVVAAIASKTKGKSWLIVLISLLGIGLYYFVYFKLMNSLESILTRLDSIDRVIGSRLHYVMLFGKAAEGDGWAFLLFTLITLALAALCLLVLTKTFTSFALAGNQTEKKPAKREGYTLRSPAKALFCREMKHFLSAPTWMLNGGLGILLLPVAAVAAMIKAPAIREMLAGMTAEAPMLVGALPVLLVAGVGLLGVTNLILPASVSLEGESIHLLQAMPIPAKAVLLAKERMALALTTLPLLLCTAVFGIVLEATAWQILLLLLATLLFNGLVADFGLFCNLKKPNLLWTNMTVVIKQSASVGLALLGGMAFSLLLGIGGYFLFTVIGADATLLCEIFLLAVLFGGLHRWIITRGAAVFQTL